ncbi:MAG: type II toxin-antitoxin system prevent-host-death family antitoxin [Spirochaetes bacterium]|jgi:prevent-host-death family protein|nr:type II toxin-antitoxin system prevent-host-death family antitoxin [Spirochaetota bacterium]
MKNSISKSMFKPRALQYFREVEKTGKEIIITDHGKKVIKIIPFTEDINDELRTMRNTVIKYDNPTESVGLEEWENL